LGIGPAKTVAPAAQDLYNAWGVIDTAERLAAFLPKLKQATWVAVDTEADSLHAYPEKVCLIQISTTFGDNLVDPLASFSIAPLLEALRGHQLIMHGADYDLRLLRKHHEFAPTAVFDTMLAARLLGARQFSLGSLVEKYLGQKLEKGQQKANWAMRPLSQRMEDYARNDTRFLKPLADRLQAELKAKYRLAWHEEACARLIAECTKEPPSDADAWRLKGSHLLSRPALAVLRELFHWREHEATAANKPPFFIIAHESLVDIAAVAAEGRSWAQLLPKYISDRRRAGIEKAVARGCAVNPEQHPKHMRNASRRPADGEKRRFVELQKHRDARAAELELDPTVIASRSTLSALAHDWEKHASELMRWQRDLLKPPPR
jgi:ribonuclease D